MKRGDIYWAEFDPVRGSEANKRRPCVIVSNDAANDVAAQLGLGVVTVVPTTTNVRRILPFQVLIRAAGSGLKADSKAQVEQIRALAVERFGPRLGRVSTGEMAQIDRALKLQLSLLRP